jgi:hypothetical protein
MNRLYFVKKAPFVHRLMTDATNMTNTTTVLIKVKIFYIYNVIIIRCVKFDKKCLTLHIIMYTFIKAVHVDMGANLFD